MADSLFGNIPFIGSLANLDIKTIGMIGVIGFLILLFLGLVVGFIIFIIHQKRTYGIIEIDQLSHRIQTMSGKSRRDPNSNSERIWLGKYKKLIPKCDQKGVYYRGKRDYLVIARDKNGLHHALEMMTYEDIKDFYKKCKDIDITQEFIVSPDGSKTENPYYRNYQMFLMPTPTEDLEFLGNQVAESGEEFKRNIPWWQHPNVMIIGCAFICFMMFVVTLVFLKLIG